MKFNWKKILAVAEKIEHVMEASGIDVAGLSGEDLSHITQIALTTGKTVKEAAQEIKGVARPPTPAP